ncbi:hypothetical protein AB4Y45_27965 [Paraburkholderia sp. EG287A]|uniref:hypothetical protein n=1 Tax=Paraburkholderia sp. EG287A TaxID=3237012 RepID=UPI0034D27EC4
MDQATIDLLAARDAALATTQLYIELHRDEKYVALANTTLTETQVHELIGYRMRLHHLEKEAGFPNIELPKPPRFMA